jgi:hypothetical protein
MAQATFRQAIFRTANLDLALTKLAAGCDVSYIGRNDGVFRFEAVKLRALMSRPQDAAEPDFEAALIALAEKSRSGAPSCGEAQHSAFRLGAIRSDFF